MQAFEFLGAAITNVRNLMGYLLGDALAPLARGFAIALSEVSRFMAQIRNDRAFRDGALSIIRFTTALLGSLGAIAAVRAGLWALQLVFSGPFGLLGAFAAIALAMKVSSMSSASFIENLKTLGKEATAVFQLITSYDPKTGLAQVGKELADQLGPKNMGVALNVAARLINMFDVLKGVMEGINNILNPIFGIMLDLINILTETDYSNFTDAFKSVTRDAGEFLGILRQVTQLVEGLAPKTRGVTGSGGTNAPSVVPTHVGGPFRAIGMAADAIRIIGRLTSNTQSSSEVSPTGSAQNNITNSTLPASSAPSTAPTSNGSANSAETSRFLAKMAAHLQNIDDKTSRKDVFGDKLVTGVAH